MQLIQISPHVYYSLPVTEGDRPVMGAVIGRRGTLVIEAGNSEAQAREFLQALDAAGASRPSFVAITHAHWDHHFGSTLFDVPILATRETMRLVKEMTLMDWSDEAIEARVQQGQEIAFSLENIRYELPDRNGLVLKAPTIGFSSPLRLELGELGAELIPVNGDHAPDSSIVWVPDDQVVFLGDCHYPDIHHGADRYTTRNLFPLLDILLGLPAKVYLPAHQPDPIPRDEFVQWADQMRVIGCLVDNHGPDRNAILARLPGTADDEMLEAVDAFLAGFVPV